MTTITEVIDIQHPTLGYRGSLGVLENKCRQMTVSDLSPHHPPTPAS